MTPGRYTSRWRSCWRICRRACGWWCPAGQTPPLPLARQRGRGQLAELRAADLRFTAQEAAALLGEAAGPGLPEAAVAALVDRTEGRAAGLQLTGLSLREQPDPAAFVAAFAEQALFEAGAALAGVVRARVMLTDIRHWRQAARARAERFARVRPATTVIEVSRFVDPHWLVEFEVDAIIPD